MNNIYAFGVSIGVGFSPFGVSGSITTGNSARTWKQAWKPFRTKRY